MANAENPYAGQGMVVLDIGGAIGALTLSAPASMAGLEIEICPSGARHNVPDEGGDWWLGDWHTHGHDGAGHAHSHGPAWPHVAVIGRPVVGELEYCAVYPGLRAGSYDLWVRPDGPTALTVTVTGGRVTNAEWPAARPTA
jgi:hypothetical protein